MWPVIISRFGIMLDVCRVVRVELFTDWAVFIILND